MQTHADLLMVIFGAALCLGGFVIFWFGTRFLGVLAGLGFGFAFGQLLNVITELKAPVSDLVLLGFSVLGALLGLVFIRIVTSLAFVALGFLFGALIGRLGTQLYMLATTGSYHFTNTIAAIIIICGVVFAVLSLMIERVIVTLITSFIGATFLTTGLPIRPEQEVWVFLIIFAAAVLWQLIILNSLLKEDKPSPPAEQA